jgi:predicted nucleic acid-binding protein
VEIAVDTSVLIAVIANEPEKEALIKATRGVDLIAPPSVHWEISNAFSAMIKRKVITLHQALQAIAVYHQIPLRFAEVELADSLQLAAELNIYAYDAYVLRCALKYNAPVLTLDKNLVRLADLKNIPVVKV